MQRLRFWELSEAQRDQARARFVDAGTGDGYWYETGTDNSVLSRNRRLIDDMQQRGADVDRRVTAARMVGS